MEQSRKAWGFRATAGLGLAIILVYLGVQIMVSFLFALVLASQSGFTNPAALAEALSTREGLLASIATFASAIIGTPLVLLFVWMRRGLSIAEYLAVRPVTWKTGLLGLGAIIGFVGASDALGVLLGRPDNQWMLNVYSTAILPVLLWVSFIIFAPVFEECMFRGFLFEGFRQSRYGDIGAVVMTALVWAAIHVQYDMYDVATVFAMGLLLGVVRVRTKSILSTFMMHAFANLIATIEVTLKLNGVLG